MALAGLAGATVSRFSRRDTRKTSRKTGIHDAYDSTYLHSFAKRATSVTSAAIGIALVQRLMLTWQNAGVNDFRPGGGKGLEGFRGAGGRGAGGGKESAGDARREKPRETWNEPEICSEIHAHQAR